MNNLLESIVIAVMNEAEMALYKDSEEVVKVISIELDQADSVANPLGERVVKMGYILSPFFKVKIPYSLVEDATTYKVLLLNKDETMVSVVAIVRDLFQYIEDYELVLAHLVGGLLLQNMQTYLMNSNETT